MYRKDQTIVDRREMLRVKVKSLAEEARIIRREEHRSWGELRNELHRHRVLIVRASARSSHLAYGLVKGRTLAEMEETYTTPPCWTCIHRMLLMYGALGDASAFKSMFSSCPSSGKWVLAPGMDTKTLRELKTAAGVVAAVAKEEINA